MLPAEGSETSGGRCECPGGQDVSTRTVITGVRCAPQGALFDGLSSNHRNEDFSMLFDP